MGLFRRLRGGRKTTTTTSDGDILAGTPDTKTKEDVVTPSVVVSPTDSKAAQQFGVEEPPSAKEAAFGGPPRYDWIDIVRGRVHKKRPT